MKRTVSLLLFFICFLFCNDAFATEYSEDNAAFWYKKAFCDVLSPLTKTEEYYEKILPLNNLEEFNNLSSETKIELKEVSNEFFINLKKAKSIKKCFFWKKGNKNEEDVKFEDSISILHGFRVANALAWYSISIDKPELAGAIWQSMLGVAFNISEHSSIETRRMVGFATLRVVLDNLDKYFNNASDDFKEKFVSYLKRIPKSILDLNEAIKIHYEPIKKNFDNYANDQRLLATLFGANMLALNDENKQKTVVDNNHICKINLRLINAGIEMYLLDAEDPDFSKMTLDEIITLFQKPGIDLLKEDKDYSCPENGKRTIKVIEDDGVKMYEVTCDCLKERNIMSDFDPNSKPMVTAKSYKETRFETDKKQMLDYYEMLLKIDHSKPMTKEQMKEMSSFDNPKYKDNAFHARLGLAYDSIREEFEATKDLIDDFITRYDK